MSKGAFAESFRRVMDSVERDGARQTLKWLNSSGWVDTYEPTEDEIDRFIAADRRAWDERARLSDLAEANPNPCRSEQPRCS